MTATPPQPDTGSERGKPAGIGGVALGALVAVAVAAVFMVLTGADRSGWPDASQGDRARTNRGETHAVLAISRPSPPVVPPAMPIGPPEASATDRTRTTNQGVEHDHHHRDETGRKTFMSLAVTNIGAVFSAPLLMTDTGPLQVTPAASPFGAAANPSTHRQPKARDTVGRARRAGPDPNRHTR